MFERSPAKNNLKSKPFTPQPVMPDPPPPPSSHEPIYVILISGVVVGLILIGLFISFSAVAEKVRLSRGYGTVLDIVDKSRQAAQTDVHLGTGTRQDMLLILERLGQITTAGESDGVKILRNPWGGVVVAMAMPDNAVRIESIVPIHVCQRFIRFLFDQNPNALGLRLIEVKNLQEAWRQTYVAGTANNATDRDIAASCGNDTQADIALVFTLRQGG